MIYGNNLSRYSKEGKRSAFGNCIPGSTLVEILAKCDNFMEEKTFLQLHGRKLGWDIMCTPKCHAELVGEGVEYMWVKAKSAYRNKRLQEKKDKAKFMDSIKRCLSEELLPIKQCLSEEVLPIDQIRKCARRAWRYVVVYNALDKRRQKSTRSWSYCC